MAVSTPARMARSTPWKTPRLTTLMTVWGRSAATARMTPALPSVDASSTQTTS